VGVVCVQFGIQSSTPRPRRRHRATNGLELSCEAASRSPLMSLR
jgi:hypothetical protein